MKKNIMTAILAAIISFGLSGCDGKIIAGDIGNNDTRDAAGSFKADGSEFSGTIGGMFDVSGLLNGSVKLDLDKEDWYKHTAGDDGFFYVTFQLTEQASDNITVTMYKSDTKIESQQTYSTSKILTFKLKQEENDVYYFQVSNGDNDGEVGYTMKGVETNSFEAISETASSNDDEASAQSITVSNAKISGTVNDSNDAKDYYKFTATSDGVAMMYIKDITISGVNISINGNSTSKSDDELLSFETTKDTEYKIYVDTSDTDGQDLSYTLYLHIQ